MNKGDFVNAVADAAELSKADASREMLFSALVEAVRADPGLTVLVATLRHAIDHVEVSAAPANITSVAVPKTTTRRSFGSFHHPVPLAPFQL